MGRLVPLPKHPIFLRAVRSYDRDRFRLLSITQSLSVEPNRSVAVRLTASLISVRCLRYPQKVAFQEHRPKMLRGELSEKSDLGDQTDRSEPSRFNPGFTLARWHSVAPRAAWSAALSPGQFARRPSLRRRVHSLCFACPSNLASPGHAQYETW
jgi:hypothetical protein